MLPDNEQGVGRHKDRCLAGLGRSAVRHEDRCLPGLGRSAVRHEDRCLAGLGRSAVRHEDRCLPGKRRSVGRHENRCLGGILYAEWVSHYTMWHLFYMSSFHKKQNFVYYLLTFLGLIC